MKPGRSDQPYGKNLVSWKLCEYSVSERRKKSFVSNAADWFTKTKTDT